MEEKAAEPAIRFAEFAGAWEQRKIKDLAANTYGGGTPSTSNPDFWEGSIPWIQSSDLSEHNLFRVRPRKFISQAAVTNSPVKIIPESSIAVITRVGVGKLAVMNFSYTTSQDFLSLSNLNTDVKFTSYQLYRRLQKDLNAVQGTSIKGITKEELLGKNIFIPGRQEQEAIGKFFSKIDSLLTLHQRKYEKLLNIKKSMLEKMFPKEGEVAPEIRFKGFTGAWEERKLGDIADITGGGTPSTSNNDYWDGIINWYSPAEISNQIFLNSSQRKITELGYSSCSAKMLPRGTVLFTSRAGIGKTAILSAEGCTNQGFQSIVPHANELDSYFIFSRTHELKKYGEVVGAGSTFVEVSGKQMAAMTLMMPPKFNEQKMIGDFFKRLDSILTLHQRKLEMLKNIKQAFLDKMFV